MITLKEDKKKHKEICIRCGMTKKEVKESDVQGSCYVGYNTFYKRHYFKKEEERRSTP